MEKALGVRTLLVLAAITFSLLLLQAGSVSSAEWAGAVQVADSGYFEAAGVAHVNQSPFVCSPSSFCYVNFTSFFALPAAITLSIDTSQLELQDFQQLVNVTRSETTFNFSQITWGNGTVDSLPVNFTSILKNFTEWVSLSQNTFTYGSKAWSGVTVSLKNKGLAQYRIKLHPKAYGGAIKYSILANASGQYVEFDPVLNATAFNVTSNSDLNLSANAKCQPDCARFIDGKLIGAAGNRSNITAWMTFPTNNFQTNPTYVTYNTTNAQAGFDITSSISVASGWLNITTSDDGGNAGWQYVKRTGNLSIPAVAGISIDGWIQMPYNTGAGESVQAHVCLMQGFNNMANSTSIQHACEQTTNGNKGISAGMSNEGGTKGFIFATTATNTVWTTGNLTDLPFHQKLVINSTHFQIFINDTEGGRFTSGVQDNPASCCSSGEIMFTSQEAAFGLLRSVRFTNFTVYNNSQFGQPANLTPAVMESVVMNTTIVATTVLVYNQSYYYANGNANLSVFNASYANTQSIKEGTTANSISSITGVGLNATLIPPTLYTASEYVNFYAEWNPPASPAAVDFPFVNVSISNSTSPNSTASLASEQLFSNVNYTNANLSKQELNSTFKWYINNTNQTRDGGNRTTELKAMIYKDAVLYMHLDENGGGTGNYTDSSGFGNTGKPFGGVSNVSGIVKGAVSFDGADDIINLSGNPALNLNTSFTIVAWANIQAAEVTGGIVSWGENAAGKRRSLLVNVVETGLATLWFSGYFPASNVKSRVKVNDDKWHHLAASVNGSAYVKIYVDGAVVNESFVTLNPFAYSVTSIGSTQVPEFLQGAVDELAIYNRTLNGSEIKQLYLRTWYDYSPQLFLLQPYKDNATGLGSSDNEAPLTVVNAKNVSGPWSGTYGVNLTPNGYVNYSASGNFNEKEGTVEFWVKPQWNGNDKLAHQFVTFEGKGNNNYFNFGKTNVEGASGDDDVFLYISNPGTVILRYSVLNWLAGDWHHLSITWNNYTSNTSLYADGVLVNNSGTPFAISSAITSEAMLVGAQYTTSEAGFQNGTISEFRISRKALSGQEINLSFSKGRAFYQNEYLLNSSNYAAGDTLKLEYSPKDSNGTSGAVQNSTNLNVHAPKMAEEAEGDTAIGLGINSSLPSATKYGEQQAYVRNMSNNQTLGRFDWVASFGSQRWLFNYVTTGESYVRAPNLTTAVYVLEITSKTSAQITDEVSKLINATKS